LVLLRSVSIADMNAQMVLTADMVVDLSLLFFASVDPYQRY
jgi:hypothetical protein